jgi:Na+/H+ antiporter NhaA
LARPVRKIFAFEASSGLLLIAAAAAALLWANSSASGSYESLWHAHVGVRLGAFVFERSLEWFVNDVLMAIIGLLTPVKAWRGKAWRGVESESPADSLLHALHPWVSFAIMPIFALANAGVNWSGMSLSGNGARVSVAVIAALLLGKPLGVVESCAIAMRTRLAVLPSGLTRRHVLVLGVVAGIGFTISLFLAQLAFEDATLLGAAKLGVLVASALALLAGLLLGHTVLPSEERAQPRP